MIHIQKVTKEMFHSWIFMLDSYYLFREERVFWFSRQFMRTFQLPATTSHFHFFLSRFL